MVNQKTLSKIAVFLLLALLIIGSVSAFIIDQHVTIGKEALARTTNSQITQEILAYEDYYHLGNILTDISVIGYFTIDSDQNDNFLDKLVNVFTFRIGKTYRATHSQNACLRALDLAETQKQRAVAYGLCSHLIQDSVSHNQGVPQAIEKTHLYNGLVHSIKEIHDKNMLSTPQDRVYSRQILDLAYEEDVMGFLEEVFVEDPTLSTVNVRNMIDFFVKQVQPEAEYRLGFKSFFALPTYIYWVILIMFLTSLSLSGLVIRRIRDGQKDSATWFTLFFSLGILAFVSAAIYGLFNGTIWSMWEVLSQYLFSPASYFVGGALVLMGGFILFRFTTKPNKMNNLGSIPVALFMLLIGGYVLTLPTGLTIGNESQIHELAIQETMKLLTQGVNYVKTIQDPVGYVALQEASNSGSGVRSIFLVVLVTLLISTIYFTFRRKR